MHSHSRFRARLLSLIALASVVVASGQSSLAGYLVFRVPYSLIRNSVYGSSGADSIGSGSGSTYGSSGRDNLYGSSSSKGSSSINGSSGIDSIYGSSSSKGSSSINGSSGNDSIYGSGNSYGSGSTYGSSGNTYLPYSPSSWMNYLFGWGGSMQLTWGG